MTIKCNFSTAGFKLEPVEMETVQNLINSYMRKIEERTNCRELIIRLKKSQHGKAFLHEVQGRLIGESMRLSAQATDYNLYAAISEVFKKLLSEEEHQNKKQNKK